MNRKLAGLALLLVALLTLLPWFIGGEHLSLNPAPETADTTQKTATLPSLSAMNTRSPAVPPEPIPLPMAVQCVVKPFLLLIAAISARLRLQACATTAQPFALGIDLCLLQSYRDHPRHAPPFPLINTAEVSPAG